MPRGKKFTAEQIIGKLREAEVELARGKTVPAATREAFEAGARGIVVCREYREMQLPNLRAVGTALRDS